MQLPIRLKIFLFSLLFSSYSVRSITCDDTLNESAQTFGSIEIIDINKFETLTKSSKLFIVITSQFNCYYLVIKFNFNFESYEVGKNCGIACNEKLALCDELKTLLQNFDGENEIETYASSDSALLKRYGIRKSPKILFFRSGAHLVYTSKIRASSFISNKSNF
jgi:hypothetical protein